MYFFGEICRNAPFRLSWLEGMPFSVMGMGDKVNKQLKTVLFVILKR